MTASALYFGEVVHARLRPRRHRLRYRVFALLVDLDELKHLRLRLLSHNRFNLFSLHDRDHGPGEAAPLRGHVERQLAAAGIPIDGGPIRLLCSPRVLGYVFNPLSLYFCHRADGTLAAVLYEVSNTFGERHSYLIPAAPAADGTVRQSCPKRFHVSPFIAMAMTYHFRLAVPAESLSLRIRETDAEGTLLAASLTGRRAALTDRTLARAFLACPLLTLKVIAGIHWEALRLWLKGVPLHDRPPPPPRPVTVIPLERP